MYIYIYTYIHTNFKIIMNIHINMILIFVWRFLLFVQSNLNEEKKGFTGSIRSVAPLIAIKMDPSLIGLFSV